MRHSMLMILAITLASTFAMGQISPGPVATVPAPLCSEFTLTLEQPVPGHALMVIDSCGGPGHYYANLFTLDGTNFPNGPLFGLDMTVNEALNQVAYGRPFFGLLNQDGYALNDVGLALPAGLVIYSVALELSAVDYSVLFVSAPVTFTIL